MSRNAQLTVYWKTPNLPPAMTPLYFHTTATLTTFLTPKMWEFPPTKKFSKIPVGYPTI